MECSTFNADSIPVANSALTLIGTRLLESPFDNTKERLLISKNWDTYRKAVLRDGFWKFATARASLTVDLTYVAPFGFKNRYQLPDNFIRVRWINGADASLTTAQDLPYRIEAGVIPANSTAPGVPLSDVFAQFVYTDMDFCNIKFIFDHKWPSHWEPLFIECFAAYIASKIAYSITGSQSAQQSMEALYKMQRQRALFVDSAEDPSEELDADVWLRARMGMPGFPRDPSTITFPSQGTINPPANFPNPATVTNAGNPNGVLTGQPNQFCWDTVDNILWICISGTMWSPVGGAGNA
jgi:hypothetical protein